MIRRINHTGRQRLSREHVHITYRNEGGIPAFDAKFDLAQYKLPDAARVFVEAYRAPASWMRFLFGTVACPIGPKDRRLSDFASGDGVRFRVKVTSSSEMHKVLAEADGIQLALPGDDERKLVPLLRPEPAPLGDIVYKVSFDGPEPTFLINERVANYREVALDPGFVSVVYPTVFREILVRAVVIDKHSDTEDGGDWHSRWLRFASLLPGVGEIPGSDDSDDQKFAWIDSAVDEFARKLQAFDTFEKNRSTDGGLR